jgi:hypothetical protein
MIVIYDLWPSWMVLVMSSCLCLGRMSGISEWMMTMEDSLTWLHSWLGILFPGISIHENTCRSSCLVTVIAVRSFTKIMCQQVFLISGIMKIHSTFPKLLHTCYRHGAMNRCIFAACSWEWPKSAKVNLKVWNCIEYIVWIWKCSCSHISSICACVHTCIPM